MNAMANMEYPDMQRRMRPVRNTAVQAGEPTSRFDSGTRWTQTSMRCIEPQPPLSDFALRRESSTASWNNVIEYNVRGCENVNATARAFESRVLGLGDCVQNGPAGGDRFIRASVWSPRSRQATGSFQRFVRDVKGRCQCCAFA